MAGVLVIGEMAGDELAPVSFEVLAAGTALAASLGEPVSGLLIGANACAAASAFNKGLATLYIAQGACFRPYTAASCVAAAEAAIQTASPAIVLMAHGQETREWAPQLAARLDTGLVTDCLALAMQEGVLSVKKPVYGGGVIGEFRIRGKPALATVRPGRFAPQAIGEAGAVVILDVEAPLQDAVSVLEEIKAASGGPKLKDAKVIVSGGRGVGGRDHWHLIADAAAVLRGAVACSRPVAESGLVGTSQQVGLSGTCVAPQLYIAVGISGAVQHLAGISAAKTVVAVNNDPEAEIFSRADYGVVGDCKEVLPAFVEKLKQLKAG